MAVCAAGLIAAGLAACGSNTDHSGSATSTTSDEVNPRNASDVAFAENMIPHHRQAMELADMVSDHSENKAVIAMADNISAQQQPEVTALSALMAQWNESSFDGGASHDSHGTMDMQGMVDDATMTKLQTLTGPAFDTLWLQSMIGHHEGAIAMAKAEIANGKNTDMIAMAKNIVAMQQLEINQMKQILEGK
jgi:uncharacterized protein (DUF305 family)